MRDLVHENLGRLLPAIFRDFRKTPTKTRYRQIARFLFGVFLGSAPFQGTLIIKRAQPSPFLQEPQVCGKWGALTERRGFRPRRNCFIFTRSSASRRLRNAVILGKPQPKRASKGARFLFGVFLGCAPFQGTLIIKRAQPSPFLQEPQVCGKRGALTERRGFRPRRNCFIFTRSSAS